MRYLLDTNACIRLLNNSSPPLVTRLQQTDPSDVMLCAVIKAELVYGAYHSERAAENLRVLARFYAPFQSLTFDDRCAEQFGAYAPICRRRVRPSAPTI